MKSKINIRMTAIAVLAIIATVIGITLINYGLFQKQVRSDLRISAKLLRDTHYFESESIRPESIDLSTDISELRVTWIGSDGTVLYDNDADARDLKNHMDRPEIIEALESGSGEAVRNSDTFNKSTFYYAVLLDNGTVLRVATNAQNIWAVFASAAPMILLIILGIIIVCIIISQMLTYQLIKPIETMAKKLEDDDFSSPYKELEPFSDMLREQHAEVLSAARARQDFTANVSHELKTPLTAISGYAELLEGGIADEKQQKHFLGEIRKNAQRLLSLIDDIINLSELDRTGKKTAFEDIDLYETVSECMEALSINARSKNIELTFEGSPCMIHANRDMIKELTENLVQNAIRYNNPGGSVEVRVKSNGNQVLIVKDNGIGIPASEQQRIFERFYRVDKSRSKATGGTGLGLAIVKHIVELHDAKITLDSAPGVGTTVVVTF
ncbi:MAG: ATP-binding protein [Eubacteriales bacterium]|nr:ATP-binding protein [Eubacteriales bacterium]